MKKTLCGINARERSEGHYMTLFQLNITCPKCKEISDKEVEQFRQEMFLEEEIKLIKRKET